MTEHYNKKTYTERRRFLRSRLSKAEAVMWMYLSRKQVLGYKFRRQYGVDQYVIDFYCPELKLAIEIDGESHIHQGAEEYDYFREEHIKTYGIRFLRFTNDEVLKGLQGVIEKIENEIVLLGGKVNCIHEAN